MLISCTLRPRWWNQFCPLIKGCLSLAAGMGYACLPGMAQGQGSSSGSLSSPVEHPIRLSGTFGELRGDHFHWGIDIKSRNGGVGEPILAAGAGHIVRITVQAGGFGQALYVAHPNGLTTVYAHLHAFRPDIASYVEEHQYLQQSFQVDLRPDPDLFPLGQGELLGRMGSTGFSFGPHLHFEVRSATGLSLNPLLHGLSVHDRTAPSLRGLMLYYLDHNHRVYRSLPLHADSLSLEDTLTIDAWRVALGVEVHDPQNGGHNRNGIYAARLSVDEQRVFAFQMDSIPFSKGISYARHIDYKVQAEEGRSLHKCYISPGNDLSIYRQAINEGVVPLYRDRPQKVGLEVSDLAGNTRSVSFWVRRDEQVTPAVAAPYQFKFEPGKMQRLEVGQLRVDFPPDALYEPLHCQYSCQETDEPLSFSPIYQIHDPGTPLRRAIKIHIEPDHLPDSLASKAVITEDDGDEQRIVGGDWEGAYLTATTSHFGRFRVTVDTMPPEVRLIRSAATSGGHVIHFQISDDLDKGTLPFSGEVGGRWALGRYDLKSKKVTYALDKSRFGVGEHLLRLVVKDYVGNQTVYDHRFTLK